MTASGRAPDMPWMSIYLTVKDAQASLDFYTRAFGFEEGLVLRHDDGSFMHCELKYQGEVPVMFAPEGTGGDCVAPVTSGVAMPVSFYFYHADVDALAARAKAAGAVCTQEPTDQFYGDRSAQFTCINGYHWSFATHTGKMSAPPAS